MATFTNIQKHRATFEAPTTVAVSTSELYLSVADGFFLNIGDEFKLVIQPGNLQRQETLWTAVNKTR